MKVEIENYGKIAKQLREEYTRLSDFEILSLAIQIERNQILENGLVVSTLDKYPSGLEAIAIALGFRDKLDVSITDVLQDIANK